MLFHKKTPIVDSDCSKVKDLSLSWNFTIIGLYFGYFPLNLYQNIRGKLLLYFLWSIFVIFCNFLPDILCHISLLEAFHSFMIESKKSLHFSCKFANIMVPFLINTEIFSICLKYFSSLRYRWIELRRKLVRFFGIR